MTSGPPVPNTADTVWCACPIDAACSCDAENTNRLVVRLGWLVPR